MMPDLTIYAVVWNRNRDLREVQASGGIGVFDETSISGMERLLELVYLLLPWLRFVKHIMLDVGHGMGQTLFFSANTLLTCIGIEQDALLHQHAKMTSVLLQIKKKVAVRFGSSNELDTSEFEGVTLVCMYESMAGRVGGPNAVHMDLVLKILRTKSVLCITTTKLQKRLMEDYCEKNEEIRLLMQSWTGCKVEGTVHRKGNSPVTCLYFRNSAMFDQPLLSLSPPTSELVQSMVNAAQHREEGRINQVDYDPALHGANTVKSFTMSWPAVGKVVDNRVVRMVYGFHFEIQDNLTGLKVVAGSTVDVGTHTGVVVGFGSSSPSPEESLGVFLLFLPNGEHICASQETLLRVVGSDVMKLSKDNYDAIKRFGKLQSASDDGLRIRKPSHRIREAVIAARTAEQVAAQQAAQAAFVAEQAERQTRDDLRKLKDRQEREKLASSEKKKKRQGG